MRNDITEDFASAAGTMLMIAPDAGGITARASVPEFPVAYTVPVSQSPPTAWHAGTPYPGPFATVQKYVDVDSIRWWGQGFQVNWSAGQFPILASALPTDLNEHVDVFGGFAGGYPSFGRHAPQSFGNQVPLFNPGT